jgi:hypothetical protein
MVGWPAGVRAVRFGWVEQGTAEEAGFICGTYLLHEFQIYVQCVKL